MWKASILKFSKIPKELCMHLIETMPKCIRACVKAHGGHAKYQIKVRPYIFDTFFWYQNDIFYLFIYFGYTISSK